MSESIFGSPSTALNFSGDLVRHGPRCFVAAVMISAVLCLGGCLSASPPFGPLHQAVHDEDMAFVDKWIKDRRNVDEIYHDTGASLEGNYGRRHGLTPLMVAAERGRLAIAQRLVEAGADIYADAKWGNGTRSENAFDYAVQSGHLDVARYLWTRSDHKRYLRTIAGQFASACRNYCNEKYGSSYDTNLALYLVTIMPDVESLGEGIAQTACWEDALPRLQFLKRHGVAFPKNTISCIVGKEFVPGVGYKPSDRVDIARFLLDQGADPNYRLGRRYGTPPLVLAAYTHDIDMVQLLVSRGADPNWPAVNGRTALNAAAGSCWDTSDQSKAPADYVITSQKAQLAVVRYLVSAGATQPPPKRPGIPLGHCCALKGNTEYQQETCKLIGDVNAEN